MRAVIRCAYEYDGVQTNGEVQVHEAPGFCTPLGLRDDPNPFGTAGRDAGRFDGGGRDPCFDPNFPDGRGYGRGGEYGGHIAYAPPGLAYDESRHVHGCEEGDSPATERPATAAEASGTNVFERVRRPSGKEEREGNGVMIIMVTGRR